jgi:hypothetical protein
MLSAEVETEFSYLAAEVAGVGLVEYSVEVGQEVGVEHDPAVVVRGQGFQPLFDLGFEFDGVPRAVHVNDGIYRCWYRQAK